jgi:2-oxoglutarate ferredoxin oxidoreductase subunit alpha
VHLRHMNPMPRNLGAILGRFEQVLVPELNTGQLSRLLRADYVVDTVNYNKIQGKPFLVSELVEQIEKLLGS